VTWVTCRGLWWQLCCGGGPMVVMVEMVVMVTHCGGGVGCVVIVGSVVVVVLGVLCGSGLMVVMWSWWLWCPHVMVRVWRGGVSRETVSCFE